MLEDIIKERKKKLETIRQAGLNPYPPLAKRTKTCGEALSLFSSLEKSKKNISLTGRLRGLRDQGKIIFADLEDESGKIQLVFKKENLKNFSFFKSVTDIGDFLSISGILFKTKKKEKSLEVKSWVMLSKSLRPLPSNFYGLEDTETRLRKRYIDLILNPAAKNLFRQKSAFWAAAREFLQTAGFLEVETPILESTPGGAEAEPFITKYNALDEDFYLRISEEISLKKIMVGGFEKIFEIGRVFRNEGIDAEHLQDYTAMEFYFAYADYKELMSFVEKMYKFIIKKTFNSLISENGSKKIDWSKKWKKVDYFEIFKEKSGLDLAKASIADLEKKAKELGLKFEKGTGKGKLIDLIFKKTARASLINPCFLINPPVEIEPLAKRSRQDKNKVERFQVMAFGTELGKGFSEANDPIDQRERFEEQMKLREKGDREAQRLDEDFLEALEYGAPPIAGFGLSERLFAVLAGKPIRECVIFPAMKKVKNQNQKS